MGKVFIVIDCSGIYGDYMEHVIVAYTNGERAKEHVMGATERGVALYRVWEGRGK